MHIEIAVNECHGCKDLGSFVAVADVDDDTEEIDPDEIPEDSNTRGLVSCFANELITWMSKSGPQKKKVDKNICHAA